MVLGKAMFYCLRIEMFIDWRLISICCYPYGGLKMFDCLWRIFPACLAKKVEFHLKKQYDEFCLTNQIREFENIFLFIRTCMVGCIGNSYKTCLWIHQWVLEACSVVDYIFCHIVNHATRPNLFAAVVESCLDCYQDNFVGDNFAHAGHRLVDWNFGEGSSFLDLEILLAILLDDLVLLADRDVGIYKFPVQVCCNYRQSGKVVVDVAALIIIWLKKIFIILIFI